MQASELTDLIVESLQRQGFQFKDGQLLPPSGLDKQTLRALHAESVRQRIVRSAEGLRRHERRLLSNIAAGHEVRPELVCPRLVEVTAGSEEELLFRYASRHWSIPVSSGYGRRLRFLVVDGHNQKLIGVIGLGDPVFSLRPRDAWVGWSKEDRRRRLHHVLDAFVLGAVPPYSYLLCGKLVAMLAVSDEVRAAFRRKYESRSSVISKRTLEADLALITTTSALGRSSVYNRLKFRDRLVLESVGFSKGSGDFHFSNGVYKEIREYAEANCEPTAKNGAWGHGFRNRREVVRKVLGHLGLSTDWQYHGIRREVFVAALAHNTKEFLNGSEATLKPYAQSAAELSQWFRERWLIRRATWDHRYRSFRPDSYLLWLRNGQIELPINGSGQPANGLREGL